MLVAELTVVPLGTSTTGLSSYVSKAIEGIKATNVKYEIHPMGTVFEAPDLKTVFKVAQNAHEAIIEAGVKRVLTMLTIDERLDQPQGLRERVQKVAVKTE